VVVVLYKIRKWGPIYHACKRQKEVLLMPEFNRTRYIEKKIRFTSQENDYLKNRINESPYNNFQNYARHLLLAGEIKFVDYTELKQLKWEINKIGNNINQVVRLANQFEDISQEDIEDLLKTIKQIEMLVGNKLEEEIRKERE
jgi:ltrF